MRINASIELNLKSDELNEAVMKAARSAMRDTVVDVAQDAIDMSPKATGNNARSIQYEVGPNGQVAKDDVSGAVYSTSGYGGYLETGTRRMKPRPYFKPALDRNFTPEKFVGKMKENL